MELVSVVGVILAAMFAAVVVCARRAALGDQMESSYEQLKHRAEPSALLHMKTRAMPMPSGSSRQSMPLGLREADGVHGTPIEVPRAS